MGSKGPTIIDLNAEAEKLTMFRGRTPTTTFVERRGSAAILGGYRDGFLLLSKSAGKGHWETHPEDELLHLLEGTMTVDILEKTGPRSFTASAGMMVVVPKDSWHRAYSTDGMNVFSATLPSDHIDLDIADPRVSVPDLRMTEMTGAASLIDLGGELAKLTMFRRSPEATAAERSGSVARLASYRDGLLLAIKASGTDHWERHITGDELIHVLDGTATLELVCDEGPPQPFALRAGTVAVIPQGAWHRFLSPDGFTSMALTPFPGETVEHDVDDPRKAESRTI
jgi:quercetin dioxygenase-like cupin family protein